MIWDKPSTPLPAGTTNSKGWILVGEQITPSWVNATGGTIFQQQFTAHPNINATVEANDGLANAVITDLKNRGVGPKKIPTTGQDATLQGMENVLTGYQCGSVYKPIYKEAQAAVALATIIRAGKSPVGPGQRADHAAEERPGQHPAGVAADPDLGDDDQHERHGHRGQVHPGRAPVLGGRQQRLQRSGITP